MADIDPEALMAEHRNESTASWTQTGYAKFYCWGCQVDSDELCLPYRLAEALATEQARTSRIRALRDAANYGGTNRVYCSDISEALNPQDPTTPDPYLRSNDA